jgi:hypothetical protein
MAVIKPFKTLLRFVGTEYYRDIESALNRLKMALNRIVTPLYIIDILGHTVIDDSWGIGMGKP